MAKTTTTTTIWKCDRCGREVEAERKPNSPRDAWGSVKVNQDAGWDMHGAPWAPRMRESVEMCGACIEDVVRMINGFHVRFDGPPGPEAGRFVEIETPDGKSIRMGEWVEDENGTWLLKMRPRRSLNPEGGEG